MQLLYFILKNVERLTLLLILSKKSQFSSFKSYIKFINSLKMLIIIKIENYFIIPENFYYLKNFLIF